MNQTLRSGPRVSEPPAPCGMTHARITCAAAQSETHAPVANAMFTSFSRRSFIRSPASWSGAHLVATGALGLVQHLVGGLVEIRRAHAFAQRARADRDRH